MKRALDIEDITAERLSGMLGYRVWSVTREKVGTGQTGASYRLTLEADEGPDTLLAKVAAGDLEARRSVAGGYLAEVGFYDELVDGLAVRTPKCWYAAISGDRLRFTLLLEDLAPRKPGIQAEACSLDRARAAVRNLAGLHAPRWNDSTLFDLHFLLGTQGRKPVDFVADLARSSTDIFVERYLAELGPENVATMLGAAAAIEGWLGSRQQPFAVLHGDYRLDNLMFGEQPDDVVVLDWQTAAVGSPTRDLAYFLGTSLKVEERRKVENDLVQLYHRELLARGVEHYAFEQCFRDYRRDLLQATLITSIGCIHATGERSQSSDAMFLSMASRSCTAIRDLGTLDLID